MIAGGGGHGHPTRVITVSPRGETSASALRIDGPVHVPVLASCEVKTTLQGRATSGTEMASRAGAASLNVSAAIWATCSAAGCGECVGQAPEIVLRNG